MVSTATGGLTVLFRRDGATAGDEISLFDGVTETATGVHTGIAATDDSWHNFGVRFNQDAGSLGLYVDEAPAGTLDLTTFAGGIYETYSNAAVGIGVKPQVPTLISWCDNFEVGGEGAVPEPSSLVLLLGGCVVLIIRRYCS